MKYLIALLLAAVSLQAQQLRTIHLTWDWVPETTNQYHALSQSDTFNLTPIELWPVVTNTWGTNWITLQVQPGNRFYAVRGTNWWGYSDFSEVVSTPTAPRKSMGFRVLRGD
jgi:hypothetical protein